MFLRVEVDVPGDLDAALRERDNACTIFNELPPSQQQDIVDWITGATEPRHRAQRVLMVVDVLLPSML